MALDEMRIAASAKIIEEVYKKLLWKVYNARCNEFLRSINKISCMHQNRSVDASTGLRDKLKVYAVEKLSGFNGD